METQGLGRRVTPNVSLVDSDPRLLSSGSVYWSRLLWLQLIETPTQACLSKGTRVVNKLQNLGLPLVLHMACLELKEYHQDSIFPKSQLCFNLCFDTSLRQEVNFLVTGGLAAGLHTLSDAGGVGERISSLVFQQTYWRGVSWARLGHMPVPEPITVALVMGHFGWRRIISSPHPNKDVGKSLI